MAGFHVTQKGKSKRWYAVLDMGKGPDGKRQQRWIGLDKSITSKREAESEARKLAVQRDQAELPNDNRMTVAQLMERWMEATSEKRKPTTTYQYRSRIDKYIAPRIGAMRISEIRARHIEQFYRQITRKKGSREGLAPQTIGVVHSMLSSAFKLAVRWELIARSPLEGIPKPTGESEAKVVLDSDQFRQLTAALAGTRMAAPALVLGTTGLRRGEVLALRWEDVDLDAGVIHIHQNLVNVGGKLIVDTPKSVKGVRGIPIPSVVVDALRVHQVEQQQRREEAGAGWVDRGLVFDDGLGDYWRPTSFGSAFTAIARRVGFAKITPHSLRHGYASIVYDATEDMKLVQELLGHSTLAVTADIYTKVFEAKKRKAADAIEQIFATDPPAPDAQPKRPVH